MKQAPTNLGRLDPDYADYIGIRHYKPELLRLVRGCLDVGVSAESLKRKFKSELSKVSSGDVASKNMALAALGALRFMLRNPNAGRVRYTRGEQYVFEDGL